MAERDQAQAADRLELDSLLSTIGRCRTSHVDQRAAVHTSLRERGAGAFSMMFADPDPMASRNVSPTSEWSRWEAEHGSALKNWAARICEKQLPLLPGLAAGEDWVRNDYPHAAPCILGRKHAAPSEIKRGGQLEGSKYDMLLALIADGLTDVRFAARALYGDDSERSRNKVHAGITYLRERGQVIREEDGTLRSARNDHPRQLHK
jgi:hypothetical protein